MKIRFNGVLVEICLACDKAFFLKDGRKQKYCSKKCRERDPNKSRAEYQKQWLRTKGGVKYYKKYLEKQKLERLTGPLPKCDVCNKEFSSPKRGRQLRCSLGCKEKHKKEYHCKLQKSQAAAKRAETIMVCRYCGKDYTCVDRVRAFCSKECMKKKRRADGDRLRQREDQKKYHREYKQTDKYKEYAFKRNRELAKIRAISQLTILINKLEVVAKQNDNQDL